MPSTAQPNILFIFPDQWRADCLGAAGHPVVRTPFIDGIAQRGLRFTAAYTPSPTCIPARASLLTGQSPSLCGRQGYRDRVPWDFEDTFVDRLNAAGYQTLLAGKTHFSPQGAACGFEVMRTYEPQYLDPGYESDYHRWLRETTDGHVWDTARSLAPLLRPGGSLEGREYVHGEHAGAHQFVTDGREKLLWNSKTGEKWFFDLTTDPQEKRNFADDPAVAERVALWERRLAKTLYAEHRREDGLSDGERLISGKMLDPVRGSG